MRTQEVLIVVRRGDEFLVVHRLHANDAYWHLVAGGVEYWPEPREIVGSL